MPRNHKLKTWGYRLFKPGLGLIFKLYYRPIIINKEAIPKDGPIIICGNHMHVYDQCPVIISTKRVIHYMAKKEYFDSKFKWFFEITGCIPVNRDIKDNNATSLALQVLKESGAIGIFPEGTRNKTKEFLLPFKFGAVSMAKKTNATIVPFGISGKYKRGEKLIIRFGEPFKVGDMDLETANDKLYHIVENLMKENLKVLSDTKRGEKYEND